MSKPPSAREARVAATQVQAKSRKEVSKNGRLGLPLLLTRSRVERTGARHQHRQSERRPRHCCSSACSMHAVSGWDFFNQAPLAYNFVAGIPGISPSV